MTKTKKILMYLLIAIMAVFTVSAASYWTMPLDDRVIAKNSVDGTAVYPNLKSACWRYYRDSMTVDQQPDAKFVLEFSGNDLVIRNLEHNLITERTVTAYCNGEARSFKLNIINLNPVITSTPDTSVTMDELYIYDVEASDSDGDTVLFDLVTRPSGMSIEAVSGIISWIPAYADIGDHNVVVRAYDAFGGETFQAYALRVNDIERNRPEFTSTPLLTAKIGELYIYDAEASDVDNDVLTYSLTENPSGMTIDAGTGVVLWTPSAAQAGDNQVEVTVSDGMLTQTQIFTVIVDAGVDVSIIAEPASGLAPLTVRFTPVINSGDGPFTLYWDFDGDGTVDITSTQTNSFTPNYYFHTYKDGTYTATLTVVDAQDDSGDYSVTIKANPKPKYRPRRIVHIDRLTTIGEYFRPGQDVPVYINFKNEDNYDLKHAKVTSVIMELGVRRSVGPFKLEKGDEITKKIFLELPANAAPGEYNIRTTISNYNGVKRIKYRTIIIK